MPRRFRYINEVLMAFCCIFLLAVAIAASIIVMGRKATVSAPGIPSATIDALLKATGKKTAYKDTFAKYASEYEVVPRRERSSGDVGGVQASAKAIDIALLAIGSVITPAPR